MVTIGGKGSSLSSASVYAIANGLCQVKIDSSVLDRLSKEHNVVSIPEDEASNPRFLTLEEARAALVVLLKKLLLLSDKIRPELPELIVETLNRGFLADNMDFGSASRCLYSLSRLNDKKIDEMGVTQAVRDCLENSCYVLDGICAVLDYSSSVLSTVADVVAAFSCEALKADISGLNLIDSGDGFCMKDEIAVANDLKVLLTGSKLVGGVVVDAINEIPKVNGSFREVARLVHLRMRVELNGGKAGSSIGGVGKVLVTTLSPLATSLLFLCESSLGRVELTVESLIKSISDDGSRTRLREMFDKGCPSFDGLKKGFWSISQAALVEDYVSFLQGINSLLLTVREIVAWEAALTFLLLEDSESGDRTQGVASSRPEVNGESVNVDKKVEKKKKKSDLGKGTAVVRQLFKERLLTDSGDRLDKSALLEKWVRDLSSFLEPKHPELDTLLKKVKEMVESNETRRLPKLPKGTRDFAKEQMAIRERAFSIIVEVFKRHGAMALDTPAFELRETLMGKYGEDSKLIYDLADQGGELCSLRYDLTVPFARYVAMNGITSFKRYQIAKVYRRDNPSKGRYREFYQCDFDIAGQYERMGPDWEVIKVFTELLDELEIGDYEIKLNHRKLLDGMLEICGVAPEKFRTICSSIDKLDKQSFEQIKKEMVEEKGLTLETADRIGTFVKKRGPPLELLSELKEDGSQFLKNNESLLALNDLEILFKALERSKCIDKVVFDLSLARGLDYYTGVIFEAVFKGSRQVGSIGAGGRYDNLIGMFGTKQVPAVGVSLGIERVFTIMEQLQKDRNQATRATETQVLVGILGDDLSLAAELVSELWNSKIKAEYMVNKRVMKHIDRAKESRIPWMVIVGEREQSEGIVKLKDIEANKEEIVPRTRLVEELQRRLNGVSL